MYRNSSLFHLKNTNILDQSKKRKKMKKKTSEINLSECREVELRIIFLRIGEIDTLNERFFAEILLEAKWIEPKLFVEFDQKPLQFVNDHYVKEEKSLSNFQKYWNPKIYIENILNDPKETINHKIKKEYNHTKINNLKKIVENQHLISSEGTKKEEKYESSEDLNDSNYIFWMYEYRKIKGYFFEKLDLKYFPLDIQNMSIFVTSYRSNREVRFIHNKTRQSIVNSNINIDNSIW